MELTFVVDSEESANHAILMLSAIAKTFAAVSSSVPEQLEISFSATVESVSTKVIEVESTPAVPVTLQQVKEALSTFIASHGMPDAMILLKSFGANRVSELAEENYAEFIAKAVA
jgi:hypothetical protein